MHTVSILLGTVVCTQNDGFEFHSCLRRWHFHCCPQLSLMQMPRAPLPEFHAEEGGLLWGTPATQVAAWPVTLLTRESFRRGGSGSPHQPRGRALRAPPRPAHDARTARLHLLLTVPGWPLAPGSCFSRALSARRAGTRPGP